MMKDKIVVSVCMITYNHENYIREAIEGVLMQKTNFPIELIIGEDCSTDNTRAIVIEYANKYPQTIHTLLTVENVGMTKNFYKTLKAATGKYIALCEGDDYWIDSQKLQKQVDFLEANEEYGLVHTNYTCIDGYGNAISKLNRNWPSGDVFNLIMSEKYYIVTASVMFRLNLNIINEFESSKVNFKMCDLNLWLKIAHASKVKYLADITTCYRILEKSASHSIGLSEVYSFHYDAFLVKQYIASKYITPFDKKKLLINLNEKMVKEAYLKKDYIVAKSFYQKNFSMSKLTLFNLKTTLFFLGTRFSSVDKLINFIYKF